MPVGGPGLAEALPRLRRAVEERGRDPEGIRVVPFGTVPTEAKLAHYQSQGIDEVVLRVPSGDPTPMLSVLDDHAASTSSRASAATDGLA